MRIAVIGSKGLPAKQGGIEHHCQELYTRLVQNGHSVDLFARQSYVNAREPYDCFGVRVIPLPSLKIRGLDALFSAALGAVLSCFSRYDVVHFHAIGPALFCWVPKVFSSAKVVVTCHGLDWLRAKWGTLSTLLLKLGEAAAVRYGDRLIVVSQDLCTYFLKRHSRRSHYLPNAPARYAVSDPNFAFGRQLQLSPGRYVMFLGRLVPEKRPDLLIQAFQALPNTVLSGGKPDWQLLLVGGSSDTSDFTTTLKTLAADNPNIIFAGELAGSQLAEIVRGAGLFVLPSDLEGLPLALLEAMNEGVPVMASNIPIHQELLSGTTHQRGLLFEAGSLQSCMHQLTYALTHPDQLVQMAERAQCHIQENFNWDAIAQDTLEIYGNVLGYPDDFKSFSSQRSMSAGGIRSGVGDRSL
jgi:glycosyltransferase involved in cell wall biosynthesis